MKQIYLSLMFFILLCGLLSAETPPPVVPSFDLQFILVTNNGTNYDVKVQIQGSIAFGLGSSNIKFNFNTAALSTPTLLTAHNFSGTLYNTMTVTEPLTGIASINIELFVPNAGTTVATTWTDVATVRFTTTVPAGSSGLSFRTTVGAGETDNPSVVFDDDQVTPLTPGALIPLNTTPLPVELKSFQVDAIEGTKAQLKWETSTEVNNYGFEIERASSMTSPIQGWEKVAFVEGHGNSNSQKNYSYTDNNLVGGSKFMYRLKQIDNDGKFQYSDAVEVEVLPTKYELMQNYPNPFNPATKIKFTLPEDAKVTLNIYNLLGEKVTTLLNEDLKAGFHQVQFNANSNSSGFASGIYLYSIETENFKAVKKMILMK